MASYMQNKTVIIITITDCKSLIFLQNLNNMWHKFRSAMLQFKTQKIYFIKQFLKYLNEKLILIF